MSDLAPLKFMVRQEKPVGSPQNGSRGKEHQETGERIIQTSSRFRMRRLTRRGLYRVASRCLVPQATILCGVRFKRVWTLVPTGWLQVTDATSTPVRPRPLLDFLAYLIESLRVWK